MFKKIILFFCLSVSVFAVEYNACFDDAGLLKAETREKIREIGNKIYQSGKAQFTVKIVEDCNDTLLGGREFFNKTGIGDKEKNNGLLLFVNAKNFKENKPGKVRLLTGYGLEGMFPDSLCGRILDEGLEENTIDAKILRMVNCVNTEFDKLGDNPIPNKEEMSVRGKIVLALIVIFVIMFIVCILCPGGLGNGYGSGGGFSSGGFGGGGGGFGGGFGGGSCGGGGAGR